MTNLLNQIVVEELPPSSLCLQLTKMGEKGPLIYFSLTDHCLCQRMSNVPFTSSSVSSVCLAYYERMSNVLAICSHTLKTFEHVQKNI